MQIGCSAPRLNGVVQVVPVLDLGCFTGRLVAKQKEVEARGKVIFIWLQKGK